MSVLSRLTNSCHTLLESYFIKNTVLAFNSCLPPCLVHPPAFYTFTALYAPWNIHNFCLFFSVNSQASFNSSRCYRLLLLSRKRGERVRSWDHMLEYLAYAVCASISRSERKCFIRKDDWQSSEGCGYEIQHLAVTACVKKDTCCLHLPSKVTPDWQRWTQY